MSSSDDDSQQRFALGFLFALIALVVATVVGVVVLKRGIAHAPTAPKANCWKSTPTATCPKAHRTRWRAPMRSGGSRVEVARQMVSGRGGKAIR